MIGKFVYTFISFLLVGGSLMLVLSTRAQKKWDDEYSRKHINGEHAKAVQKPVIDSAAIVNWPSLSTDATISPSGNYFQYTIHNIPREGQTLVVQKTDNSWRREYPGVTKAFFTLDNRHMVFQKSDSLCFLSLSSKKETLVARVKQYTRPKTEKATWLLYQLITPADEWVLLNLSTGKKQTLSGIVTAQFSENGKVVLLLKKNLKDNNTTEEILQWLDTKTGSIHDIWSANHSKETISCYSIDASGSQVAFIVSEKEQSKEKNSIWYFNAGTDKAVLVANDQSKGTDGLQIAGTSISFNDRNIVFELRSFLDKPKQITRAVMLDVWSYKDSVLQSSQLLKVNDPERSFRAIVNPGNKRVFRLEREDERVVIQNAVYAVVANKFSIQEDWWDNYSGKAVYLVNLKEGNRKRILAEKVFTSYSLTTLSLSPAGKFLIFYDLTTKAYYSYDLRSTSTVKMTDKIGVVLNEVETVGSYPVGIAGWLPEDSALLIYDNYDIWKVNPTGKSDAINITNAYGRKYQLKIRILDENPFLSTSKVYDDHKQLLLSAFDTVTKYNGFYRINMTGHKDPELLSLRPCHIYTISTQGIGNDAYSAKPIKAINANQWLVARQTEMKSPNYFLTSDFKTFKRLTNWQPQREYNWLTSELITFKQLDGTSTHALLYKPENFNPAKQYPVIFFYYEKFSDNKYTFYPPEFGGGMMNIPWLVSRGYLVFTPDIHYTKGKTGESVCNAVIAAAQYAAKLPYVDASKMAITGHSFGGYETNYLVTHSNIFAAAASANGLSNFVSAYGGLNDDSWGSGSAQWGFEIGQYRMGYTVWNSTEAYIKNSPIFSLNNVTTPLLITHNKKDALVPWSQSIELFTGLRRLRKPVWMLQYDKGAHGLEIAADKRDWTKRITQFFDHYLKGAPPPRWLTQGIPAKLKGIDTGFELDPEGFCSDSCKICAAKKYADWQPIPF